MDIRGLQERVKGTYDLTDLVDCQSVISMLLGDLKSADLKLKGLALLVKKGDPDSVRERVDKVLEGHKSKSPGEMIEFIMRMGSEMKSAESMSDDELTEAVVLNVWGELKSDSPESAQLSELVERFKGQEKEDVVADSVS